MPRVSVHIVTYNSLPYLENSFRSLAAQTFTDHSLLIIDNASTDGTVAFLDRFVMETSPTPPSKGGDSDVVPPLRRGGAWGGLRLVKNRDNVGFARAHNQAIHFTDSEYVLVLNPDVILHEKFLERLVRAMDAVPQAGSATGKILKAMGNPKDWLYVIANEVKQSPGDRHVPTAVGTRDDTVDIIDSTGITGDRKRLFRDRGAGEEDRGQYDHEENISRISHIGLISRIGCEGIVGSSGAAAFYRRVALDSVEFEHEFFDELYHSYKEDIDLALRLSRRGWQCVYVPNARAYHFRSLSAPQFQYRLRGYMKRPSQLVFLSYRNHLYTLIKNEPSGLRDLPWIIGWEFGKMMFLLVIKPWVVVKAWRDIIKNWRELMERRKQNQKSKIKNQNEGISSRRVGTP